MTTTDRYDASDSVENQHEPGSRGRVLRNLLGIKTKREMDEAETVAHVRAMERLSVEFDRTYRFCAADICRIHKIWLGGIYTWAGRYRQTNLSKAGFHFAAAAHIPALMEECERGPLASCTPTLPGPIEKVAEALAVVHGELILIHPFREGNGRMARLLANLMAFQAGYRVFRLRGFQGAGKIAYIDAIRGCLDRDYRRLAEMFAAELVRMGSSRDRS